MTIPIGGILKLAHDNNCYSDNSSEINRLRRIIEDLPRPISARYSPEDGIVTDCYQCSHCKPDRVITGKGINNGLKCELQPDKYIGDSGVPSWCRLQPITIYEDLHDDT